MSGPRLMVCLIYQCKKSFTKSKNSSSLSSPKLRKAPHERIKIRKAKSHLDCQRNVFPPIFGLQLSSGWQSDASPAELLGKKKNPPISGPHSSPSKSKMKPPQGLDQELVLPLECGYQRMSTAPKTRAVTIAGLGNNCPGVCAIRPTVCLTKH